MYQKIAKEIGNRLNWTQIMCNSDYHEYTVNHCEVKISCCFELQNIEFNDLDEHLISLMTRLKIATNFNLDRKDGSLRFLYELIVSKLNGKVQKNLFNKEGYLFKQNVKHNNGQYWFVVLNTFHYLLNMKLIRRL